MGIFRGLVGPFKKVQLPKLHDIATLRARFAYLCLEKTCPTVMERAPQGRCVRCGSENIAPVQAFIRAARRWKWQQQAKETKTPDEEATRQAPENLAAFLTDFRAA